MLPKFVKVYPHEFKRVMTQRAQKETAPTLRIPPVESRPTATHV